MSEVTRVREARTYSKESPHSFFADVARSTSPTAFRDSGGARSRLDRHAVELLGELRANRHSAESRHILRTISTEVRSFDLRSSEAEFRALSTGTGSGLAFVTPEYLVSEYREYREYPPAFFEQLPHQPVPDFGMSVNIPAITGPAGVVKQSSEGSADQETDPTGTYLTANLGTFEGQVIVSQPLLDRSGPGTHIDQVLYKQMRQEYDAAIDADALTTAIAGAQTITDSTVYAAATFIPNLYGDLYNAGQKLETAAGTKLRPTHHFFLPGPWGFIASQTGSDVRPILLPNANPNADTMVRFNSPDQTPGGYTGYNFAGVPAFVDGNIPLTSGNATILTINAGSLYPFCTENPTVVSYIEPLAADLQVVIRLHGYAATLVLFPNGVCAISGAAYSATPTFA